MSQSNAHPNPTPGPDGSSGHTTGIALLGLAACALAISARSYWLDETVIYKATMPTLALWWQSILAKGTSEVQQPLYNLFAWAWEKLVGQNEFAMRAGNAPWFVLAIIVAARALAGKPALRWGYVLALLTSPFAWYYLNETRPYAVQISTSVVVFTALYRLACGGDPAKEGRWVFVLCFGSVLLAASGLLAMLWLGAYLGAALLSTPAGPRQRLAKAYWPAWSLLLAVLFAQGLYYLWTLTTGARASSVGATDFKNVLFLAYELLGFSGLGPGRLAIRAGGLGVFRPWLPWLAVYGAVLLPLLVLGWRRIAGSFSRRTRLWWATAFLLVGAFILTTGVVMHFRVLGRHCAAALPLALFLPAMGVASLLERGRGAVRLVVVAFMGLSLASCGMLRLSERHAKDDYRGAAALAREALARGEVVWWDAAIDGALIYHLPLAKLPGSTKGVFCLMNPGQGFARDLPTPQLVVVSKPDVFDLHGAIADYLSQAGFRQTGALTAFTVWGAPQASQLKRPD